MSVATIVITATRANAPATTIINRGPTGPTGPTGPAGADSITSATTSDGTADINFNQVGIGTTSPDAPLHVEDTSTGYNQPVFKATGGTATVKIDGQGTVWTPKINLTDTNQGIAIKGAGRSRLWASASIDIEDKDSVHLARFDTDNLRVGIGTTSPAYPLDVNGIIKTSSSFLGTTVIIQKVTALNVNGIQFTNNGGSEKMRISDNGNVGIGTTSPSQKLDVDGAVKKAVFTVNTLPTATAGTSCYVSDSNHTHHSNVGQVVASGGSNFVPVYYDGTDWRIG